MLILNKPIMIIDDIDLSLELLRAFLCKAGFSNIVAYECPIKALHEIEQGLHPALIITDYKMPAMNGIQFIEAAFSVCKPVSTIIISGDISSIQASKYNSKLLEKGMPDFFNTLISMVKSSFTDSKSNDLSENFKILQKK